MSWTKPAGMPLRRFVVFDWAGGLENTGEVWQGKVGAERNDGKGAGRDEPEYKNSGYFSCKQQSQGVILFCLILYCVFD